MKKARRLLLKGLYNARDLGGFPTADGGVTKFGVFVRSEAPCDLPDEDIGALKDYGITTTIDLRGSGEKNSRPSSLKDVMDYIEKPLFNEAAIYDDKDREASREEGGAQPPKPKHGHSQDWGEQYKQMAEEARGWAIDMLDIAANCDGGLLYHCTTGKDRTGLFSCYLLSVCGVAREDIAADYCISQIYLAPVYARMRSGKMDLGPAPDGADVPKMDDSFFKTPAEAMLTLIDYLVDKYGSVVDYLRLIGVSEETMDKIRNKFIDRG